MIGDLPSYFSWTRNDPLAPSLQTFYVDAMCTRFQRYLRWLNEEHAGKAEELIARTKSLSDSGFMRLLTAPAAAYRLGYDGRANLQETRHYLEDALAAEELREGLRDGYPSSVWCALGDAYFPTGSYERQPEDDQRWEFDCNQPFRSPRNGDIVIDFASPAALEKLPQVSGQACRFLPDEAASAVAKVNNAISVIDEVSSHTSRMMRYFTRVIVLRKDPSHPELYTSASTSLGLMRPVLRNPHLRKATIGELTDGLIHESIHCVCDLLEMREGLWLTGPAADAIWVHSPWTGRRLDLHTYLQACWVWYGLWNFWKIALNQGPFDLPTVTNFLGRAYKGFQEGEAVHRLENISSFIRPEVMDALSGAQFNVLADMRLVCEPECASS